jgi:hypothetical protein
MDKSNAMVLEIEIEIIAKILELSGYQNGALKVS